MSMTHKFFHNKERGVALILIIFFFIAISLVTIETVTFGAITELRTYRTLADSKFAYVAAEAGIEDVFYRTVYDKNPVSETITLNGATSQITVIPVSATQNDVYASGVSDNRARNIFLSISNNKIVQFPYGAHVGEGGITLGNNAGIDGTGLSTGSVYSNGQVVGAPGVVVTGSITSSSGLSDDPVASSSAGSLDEELGGTNPNIDYAQSFVMSTTTPLPLASVKINVKRQGNPTGASVVIVADNAGVPGTVALATQAFPYSAVSTSYTPGYINVSFATPAVLTPGQTYWIILDTTQNNGKYWYWRRSASDSYTGGSVKYKTDWSTAGAWTAVAGDLDFTLTYGGGVSKIDNVTVSGNAKADTINNATISGDAYYKVIDASSQVRGSSCNPTATAYCHPSSQTPPYIPLPISTTTIEEWKNDAKAGGTISGSCGSGGLPVCDSDTFPLTIGPKEITGNIIMDNNQTLTVNGTLYVHGNIDISNNSLVRCAIGYGVRSCIVIADGYINVHNNGTFMGSGVAGSFVLMLTTKKDCIGTSGTGCAMNNSAIEITNNVNGALFYSNDSLIDISNGAQVTAVVGYKLQLQNNGYIHYDPLVSSVTFSATANPSTGGWNANRWNEY